MRPHERFLRYAQMDTTSDPAHAGPNPSTQKQFALARLLADEMRTMGLEDVQVSDTCYVYGFLPATAGCEAAPALGLVAHMDTSPAARGAGVQPLLHPGYDGKDLTLPSGRVVEVERYPAYKKLAGETLITASGNTLLGADDKAGIAEILTACERLLETGAPHGRLCIAFTPDEEIGAGTDGFDLAGFGAAFAYTVDGGDVGEIEYETFNAAHAKIALTGNEVHPGTAKDILVNACTMALQFDALLPGAERPEHTEGREGFYHLTDMAGTVGEATLEYIIRDHDKDAFEARKARMRQAADELAAQYGPGSVKLTLADSYYNMAEVIEANFHLVEHAREAIAAVGLTPETKPIRGGTDGSKLSFMGLPCPNLGTGGFYFHGPYECITAERMDKAVEVLLQLVQIYAACEG